MISHLYPNSTPALNLNFKSSRVADPRIRCTRSTTATYVDPVSRLVKTAGANEVRVEKGGLLAEETRANSCIFSENFTGTNWSNQYTTITANATTAPDGTNTASSLMETAVNNEHRLTYITLSSTKNCTSIFVKPNGRDNVAIRILYGGNGWMTAVYNLTGDGAVTQVTQGSANAYIEIDSDIIPLSNGWYRISLTTELTFNAPNQQYPILLSTCTSSTPTLDSFLGVELFTGDTTKGVYVWGAQFELEKDFHTSYIPTSGSTVTRNADELSFLNNNLNSWYNNNQGAFLIDINALGFNGDYARLMQTNQNHRFEYSQFSSSSAKAIHFNWLNGGTSRTPLGTAPLGKFNIAANYSIGNVSSICIDGAETLRSSGNTAGTAAHTAPTELRLCRQSGNSQYLSSYVKRLVFYQAPIANTALEALTQ